MASRWASTNVEEQLAAAWRAFAETGRPHEQGEDGEPLVHGDWMLQAVPPGYRLHPSAGVVTRSPASDPAIAINKN